MKISQLLIRSSFFLCAFVVGVSTVAATRMVIGAMTNVTEPVATVERPIAQAEKEPIPVFDEHSTNPVAVNDFDPSGDYELDIEKVPRAFSDIEFFTVTTREYADENGTYTNRPIIPTGLLMTKKEFAFTKIAIADREISFETEAIDGISYQFVGQFYDYNELVTCETCEYPAPLTGKLTKKQNGKVVAALNVKFYDLEHC